MGKLDNHLRHAGANIGESMGQGREQTFPVHIPVIEAKHQGVKKSQAVFEIPLSKIAADPNQPRTEFDQDELANLAQSIKDWGQLQPIVVRWDEAIERYVIVVGERRWRAAELAGCTTMRCQLDEHTAPGDLLVLQLIENCLRQDLKPVEKARGFRELMDRKGWTAVELAANLAIHQSTVSRALALLELPEPVQELVETGQLPPASGYLISQVPDPVAQIDLAGRAVDAGLTRGELEVLARSKKPARRATAARTGRRDIVVKGGSVRVVLDDPEPTPELVLIALKEATAKVRSELKEQGRAGEAA